jgi:hypothetical protein
MLTAGARLFGAESDDAEFFEKKIRPLLVERCYECHSAEKKIKAGLRLDTREGWMQGGDSGPAVVAGNVDQSPLIKAVRYTGVEFEAMPPKSALPRDEIALLEEWVKRGAPGPSAPATENRKRQVGLTLEEGRKFWAFVPPNASWIPSETAGGWARTDLDRFIAAAWKTKGLKPAVDAEKAALFRRASFDLMGLPPTPEALDVFLRDRRPDAFARAVDAMLATPQFGERWGRHWLDVARFAESSGGGRTLLFGDAWRYRDYVIEAFNRDLPFNQFIREQLAGDLLPASSPEDRRRQLTATAFLALGPTNYEEQNKDALRMDIVDEQLDVIGKGFLGMTIGCARCHDHKFDPIPTRDYYALAGILRSTHTLANYTDNVAKWVDVPLPMDGNGEKELTEHQAKVADLQKAIARLRGSNPVPITPGKTIPIESLPGIVVDDTQAKVVGTWKTSQVYPGYVGSGYLSDNNEGKGGKTATFTPPIPQSGRYEVRLAYNADRGRAEKVPVTVFHADGENVVHVNQREQPPIAGRFISLGTYRFEKDGAGYVLVSTEGTEGYVIVDALQFIAADARPEPPRMPIALADSGEARKNAAEIRRMEQEMRKLTTSGPKRNVTMSVREATGEISDTEIRIRGNARSFGPKVPRGVLAVATRGEPPRFPDGESGRRELADWIANETNPLTARVAANRVWSWLMGAGLVRSVDNFGTTGERPSHPELLDHLARSFVAEGWSIKKLVRTIVLSRTYQLASIPAADASRLDPDNRLFTHANRRRLEAEEIRDAILATSDRLDLTVGGPNIANLPAMLAAAQGSEYGYNFTDTRRSVYTPAFRNRRLELFEVFDFADINASAGQRTVTTVAPQALFLMNHPFVIEQAKLAAERLLRRAVPDDRQRIEQAYRVTLGRLPTAKERALALEFVGPAEGGDINATARLEVWTEFVQSLFACVDFRYVE